MINPIIEYYSRDLVPEYCQGRESSAVYTLPPSFVESLPGHSNRSLRLQTLHTHAEEIIPTFLISNIYFGICLPKALTLTWLRQYEMFNVLLIVRINKSLTLQANAQLPHAKRHVSVPAGARDSFQGGSCVASTIQGQNSTPSSLLNNCRFADITQRGTSILSAT